MTISKKNPPYIYPWLKPKGYIHITRNINIKENQKKIIKKITNPYFISKYAFYPLIHTIIKERKYKKNRGSGSNIRKHSFWENASNTKTSSVKIRPLHYATHFDALIYSYYAHNIQEKYESKLSLNYSFSECITAYRKLKINNDKITSKGKSTIHFSKEVFDEIKIRYQNSKTPISVLTFDIKSFFSTLNHDYLELMLCKTLNVNFLPPDYKNIFNATTKFSYIYLNDLKLKAKNGSNVRGFDEKKLNNIRKSKGFSAFFESPSDFRRELKEKKIRIYTKPFMKNGKPIGIPQGLPNSAIFANLYLYNFDKTIFENLTQKQNIYYRRYSDDMIFICDPSQTNFIKDFVYNQIKEVFLEASKEKTEEFIFEERIYNKKGDKRLTSIKQKFDSKTMETIEVIDSPLIYLGFEFRGYNTLIKSSNVSKFYRRLIYSVKRKTRRIQKHLGENPTTPPAIFINQLKPIFLNYSLHKEPKKKKQRIFVPNYKGEFDIELNEKDSIFNSNFYSYIKRANLILGSNKLTKQFRKAKNILSLAIKKNLKNIK